MLDELRARRRLGRDPARARRPGVRDDRRLRQRRRALAVARARASPRRSCRSSTARSSSPTARTRISGPSTTRERGARTHLLARVEQLHGKPLSFNNLNDLSAARLLSLELDGPACVIVKHGESVRRRRRRDDRGGLREGARRRSGLGVRRRRRAHTGRSAPTLGERLAEQFVEVLFAPGYDAVAVEALVAEARRAGPQRHGAARASTRPSGI